MKTSARSGGFTLIELLLVVALIAVASSLATFALRDPSSTQLENEAARLASLLESARAQSRATGLPVRWEPRPVAPATEGFRFVGLTPGNELPDGWLGEGVSAEIIGKPALVLGPGPGEAWSQSCASCLSRSERYALTNCQTPNPTNQARVAPFAKVTLTIRAGASRTPTCTCW